MPSVVVEADDTAVVVAAERKNACVQAKSLTIDNQVGAGDCEITIQDNFNESAFYNDENLAARLPPPIHCFSCGRRYYHLGGRRPERGEVPGCHGGHLQLGQNGLQYHGGLRTRVKEI